MRYDSKGIPVCPVKMGERVIVMNRSEKAVVENIQWLPNEGRWRITLDWGSFGMSRIHSDDEGKVWKRYDEVN